MRRLAIICIISSLALILVTGAWAGNTKPVSCQAAIPFAKLPDGVSFPEGITTNPYTGEIIVGTFDFSGNNYLLRFRRNGQLVARKFFDETPLLGLAFNLKDKKIYIANFGASKIQRIQADFTSMTAIENVANIPPSSEVGAPPNRIVPNPDGSEDEIIFDNAFPAPNGLVFSSE